VFLNLSKDVLGIDPHDGVTHQVTGFGRRTKLLPGVAGQGLEKCVDLAPGKPFEAVDLEGPGLITRIWVTLPGPLNPGALRNITVKMYWDDETTPSVIAPLGDLFGATFGHPREFESAYVSIFSGAFLSFFPMPFARRARIVLENEGPHTVRLFFFQVTYLKLRRELDAHTPYFHCHWRRTDARRGDPPCPILDARGRGFYLGCHLDMQGKGFPWGPNPFHWFLPEGFGMGMLEGWERMWIDRDPETDEPNVHGTGGEDYFNGAWYFTSVPSTSLTHGVTRRSNFTRQVSCYRLHAEMPVAFEERLRITIDHGLNNALPARYDSTAYWYQSEPHAPMPELPPAVGRRPDGAATGFLTMSVPALYAGITFAAVRTALKRLSRSRRRHT
jgi:hypothetical protein